MWTSNSGSPSTEWLLSPLTKREGRRLRFGGDLTDPATSSRSARFAATCSSESASHGFRFSTLAHFELESSSLPALVGAFRTIGCRTPTSWSTRLWKLPSGTREYRRSARACSSWVEIP
jgi:hypothetical protein